MSHKFVVYKDVPVPHTDKQGKNMYWGDIPIATYNEQTEVFEPVVNNRGYAYATRHQMRYRKNKKNNSLVD